MKSLMNQLIVVPFLNSLMNKSLIKLAIISKALIVQSAIWINAFNVNFFHLIQNNKNLAKQIFKRIMILLIAIQNFNNLSTPLLDYHINGLL